MANGILQYGELAKYYDLPTSGKTTRRRPA